MKLAFLHATMGLVNRGSEISTSIIVKHLAKKHQVLTLTAATENLSIALVNNTHVWDKLKARLYLDDYSLSIKQFTRSCLPKLKAFKPDVLVPVNGSPQIHILQQVFPKTPIVVFGRAGIGWNDADNLKTSPHLFIALTPTAQEWAKQRAQSQTRVVYIPNPIDLKPFRTAKAMAVPVKSPIVLVVAALTKYKNIATVIQAMAHVKASLVVCGEGEDQRELEVLAKTLLPKRHVFLSLPSEKMPNLYKAANVFCLVSSKQEAFGRVYIEAMAAGLPIIATDDEKRRHIIGPSGIYVNPDNEKALRDALLFALKGDVPDYSSKLVEYSINSVVHEIEQEFRKLCSS